MRDIAAAVLKQAKAELAEVAKAEGRRDYKLQEMDGDAAWDNTSEWRREETVAAIIDRMVRK